MNIIGEKVHHSTFGDGIITEKHSDQIRVLFKKGEKVLVYPFVFEKLMHALDGAVNNFIQIDVVAFQAERQVAVAEKGRIAFERKQADDELSSKSSKTAKKGAKKATTSRSATSKKLARDPNKRSTFFVFQEKKFDREYKGGYVWSPISSGSAKSKGANPILDVREGDVIFHGHEAQIWALSVASGKASTTLHPADLFPEEKQDSKGNKVKCEYYLLQNPVKTEKFRENILQDSNELYAPFDKNGDGNTAYFYDLHRDLALVFLQGLIEDNSDVKDLEFVGELLSELA